MKKLFSSAISVFLALPLVCGNGILYSYAESAVISGDFNNYYEDFTFEDFEDFNFSLPESPSILSNYSSESYIYRDYLDDNNLAVYDILSTWTTPSLEEVIVELPETINITLSAMPGSDGYTEEDDENFRISIFENCKPGIDSMLFDNPEIFWLDESMLSIGINSAAYSYNWFYKTYTLSVTSLKFTPAIIESLGTLEAAFDYKAKLEDAINNFDAEGVTRYDQIKKIHDTICLFTEYDMNAKFSGSALGSLVEPGVVCEGYAKGFKLICDRLNIPCVLVFGNYDEENSIAHMWNSVQMEDGKWYGIDVTWDDIGDISDIGIKYDYFLRGSENFFKLHTESRNFNITYFTYPELSVTDYSPSAPTITTTTVVPPVTTTSTTTTVTETAPPITTSTVQIPDITTSTTSSTAQPIKTTTTTIEIETTTTTKVKPTTTTETEPITTTTKSESSTTTTETKPITTTTTKAQPEYEKADFNKDYSVNMADLILCAKAIMRQTTEYDCDYNSDGLTDIFDLIGVRVYILLSSNS